MHVEMTRLKKLEQSAAGDDGHYDFCCAALFEYGDFVDHCRHRHAPVEALPELVMCYGCPRTFHEECMPEGAIKREDGAMLCDLCAPVGWQALLSGWD